MPGIGVGGPEITRTLGARQEGASEEDAIAPPQRATGDGRGDEQDQSDHHRGSR